jgi:hypothetical protein
MPRCASGGLGHEAYGTLSLLGGHAPLAVRISFIFPRDSCPVAPFSHFCTTTRCQFLRQQAARPYISSAQQPSGFLFPACKSACPPGRAQMCTCTFRSTGPPRPGWCLAPPWGGHLVEEEGELELGLHVGIGLERVGAGHAPSGHSETRRSATARCPTRFPVSAPSASPPFPRVFTFI